MCCQLVAQLLSAAACPHAHAEGDQVAVHVQLQ